MTEETNQDAPKTETKSVGRPAKNVKIKNTSQRPITLIIDKNTKGTILPTQTAELSKEFMEQIRKNKAAMTFFDSGDLVEV